MFICKLVLTALDTFNLNLLFIVSEEGEIQNVPHSVQGRCLCWGFSFLVLAFSLRKSCCDFSFSWIGWFIGSGNVGFVCGRLNAQVNILSTCWPYHTNNLVVTIISFIKPCINCLNIRKRIVDMCSSIGRRVVQLILASIPSELNNCNTFLPSGFCKSMLKSPRTTRLLSANRRATSNFCINTEFE
jgi:hypothetical protein